jgi:hypothetical protein
MKKIVTHVLSCLISFSAIAQAHETVYFHFDKDVYLPGETIWYKAYLYNDTRPAVTSTNLYTAIYDAGGKLLQQKQYPIFESVANGEFVLPDTIANGNLIFRAFTKTMLQQDSVNVYQQLITIAGNSTTGASAIAETAVSSIQFFPEGGHLLAGVQNFLGISTRFTDGSPIVTKGIIKKDKTELSYFETDANGMALVQLMPETNTNYYAEWADENGILQKQPLPPVKEYGAALHTEMTGNSLYYMVSKNNMATNLATMHIVAQQGADMVYKADLLMDKTMQVVNQFRTDSLASGLLLVNLYDNDWKQLAQRTLFVNSPEPPLKLNIKMLTSDRAAKKKNVIEIEIPDSVKTNLSVSIADAGFYKEEKMTISEALLLGRSAPLPAHGDSTQTKLTDLFTLNNTWPLQAAGNAVKEPVPADNYLDLNFNSNRNFSAKEALTVIINDKLSGKQFFDIAPAAGSFTKSGLVFFDSAKMYYQLLKNKELVDEVKPAAGSRLQIPGNIAPLKTFTRAVKKTDISNDSVFVNFAKAKPATFNAEQTLNTVTVKSRYTNPETKRQLEIEDKYATGPFKGAARGFFLNVMDDPDAENVIDIYNYIAYRVPGLKLVNRGFSGKRLVVVRAGGEAEPLIFINEQESPNEALQTIPISQIAYVKFVSGTVVSLSHVTTNGALYVYLKKGNEPLPPAKNMRIMYAKGYNSTQQFTQPDYEDKANLLKTDNRSTLYWNPYVMTDAANPKFTIEYYNNDLSKKLLLVIEGMDERGRLVHIKKIIE